MVELKKFIYRGKYAVETHWINPIYNFQMTKTTWVKGRSKNKGYNIRIDSGDKNGFFRPIEHKKFNRGQEKQMEEYLIIMIKELEVAKGFKRK